MPDVPSHEKLELEEPTIQAADFFEQNLAGLKTLDPEQIDSARHPELIKASDTSPGQTIAGKYEILEKLGAGGMSTVFKVRHLHLNKILALKLLHKANDQSSVQRFSQEAKASSLLEHPNIVRVHDFGVTGDGLPFMTMDCLQGPSLSELLRKEGSLSVESITKIFGQICLALAHAHAQGVVHRDIKPSNIMIVGDSIDTEQAIVVDFGIAKIISDGNENLTQTGDIFGTPTYMSPEQCQGQRIDARSDIYSLGCVLYEAATGKPPFQADSVYHLIHKQITEAPAPFPDSLRKTQTGRQLEALVLKSMAKSPTDRHRYILELSSELKAIEYGTVGLLNEFGAIYRTFSARLRATERQVVLTKWTLKTGSVMALIIACLLVGLPAPIQEAQAEMKRNLDIIALCSKISSERFEEAKNDFWATPVEGYLTSLQPLCQSDPKQTYFCKLLIKRSRESGNSAARIQAGIDSMDYSSGVEGIKRVMAIARQTVGKWAKANKTCNTLSSLSVAKKEQAESKFNILSTVMLVSRALALPIEILLLIAIIKRFKDIAAARKDDLKYIRQAAGDTTMI